MDAVEARKQWDSAAPGWAKWEPEISAWIASATKAMLDGASIAPGHRVLDIACGAGEQSLAAARRVGPRGHVLATDISDEMISYVSRQARAHGLHQLHAMQAAAEDLPDSDLFDAAICRLGLMLIPEPLEVLRQVRRRIRPGARLAVVTIGAADANPFLSEPLRILRARAGKAPPPPGAPGIFALSEPGRLAQLLEEAGYDDADVAPLSETVRLPSSTAALQMMQEAFGVYRALVRDQPADVQQDAWREVLEELRAFETADGFQGPSQMLVASARNPG